MNTMKNQAYNFAREYVKQKSKEIAASFRKEMKFRIQELLELNDQNRTFKREIGEVRAKLELTEPIIAK